MMVHKLAHKIVHDMAHEMAHEMVHEMAHTRLTHKEALGLMTLWCDQTQDEHQNKMLEAKSETSITNSC